MGMHVPSGQWNLMPHTHPVPDQSGPEVVELAVRCMVRRRGWSRRASYGLGEEWSRVVS